MKKFLLYSLAFTSFAITAQDYRFGKVESTDFERLTPIDEEEPAAEVLYRNEDISFRYSQQDGFVQTRTVHERIKINTEEGLEYATNKVRLYDGSNSKRERLLGLTGYTYNLQGKEVDKEKLRSSGEFEEKLNEYWKQSSFTMPNARIGSIIEYEYYISSPFTAIDDVLLQYNIPIRKMDLRVEMVEYYNYNVYNNPRASYTPELNRSVSLDSFTIRIATTDNSSFSSSTRRSQKVDLKNNVISLNTENIPALEKEPMSGSLSNYRAKLQFELATVAYPNQPIEILTTNWESISKSIYKYDDFGGQLEKRPFYDDDLEAIVKDATNAKERVVRIFDFVKSKVKWNNYYGFRTQKGIKEAYKEGSGNVADINLLLTSMLDSQGIDAIPVLVSSIDNGIPLFPTKNGFDYVVVLATIDGDQILMDATDENTYIGELPLRATNWQGRAVSNVEESFWINLIPKELSSETILSAVELNEDMSITGKVSKRFSNYLAYNFRDDNASKKIEDIIKSLEAKDTGVEISNLELINIKNLDKPLDLNLDIKLNNSAEQIGDKVYITPLLNESNDSNPFKLDSRNLPINFNYPISTKTVVNLTIPENYTVESLPASEQINFNDGVASYKFITSTLPGRITIIADFVMNESYIFPENYSYWKDFFTAVVAKDAEKIVLKKI